MRRPILIVEDRADDALLLENVLRRAGVTNPIDVIATAEEAVTYVEQKSTSAQDACSPGVVFLDLKLPGMDGFQFLRRLRGHPRLADALIVVLTAFGDASSIARAYRLGANSFLAKPLRLMDVENLIQGFPRHWSVSVPPTAVQSP